MARPRSIDDDILLDHAGRALAAEGIRGFTLQAVADRAGVSPAMLVQRFGSKRGLLVAVSHRWVATVDDDADAALADVTDPVARIPTIALAWFAEMDDPDTVTNVVSALANDLLDDELRGLLAKGWATQQDRLERELRAAVRAGRLDRNRSPLAWGQRDPSPLAWGGQRERSRVLRRRSSMVTGTPSKPHSSRRRRSR